AVVTGEAYFAYVPFHLTACGDLQAIPATRLRAARKLRTSTRCGWACSEARCRRHAHSVVHRAPKCGSHLMRMLKCLLLVGMLLVGTARGVGGELPVARPEAVGLSSGKLKEARAAVQALVDQKEVAGAVLAVARRGKVVQLDAVGVLDVGGSQPMKPDTIFRIYSMTKPVTTVAAMMLVEDGKIRLDDPVAKYVPAFKDLRVHTGKGDE